MPLKLQSPIIYLITSGTTTEATTTGSQEFNHLLKLVEAATAANISLIQLREKSLTARVLHELTLRCAQITRGSETRLLVNDRADIACAAGANGVHLTTSSMAVTTVRQAFGEDLLVGVSAHSVSDVQAASAGGADFAVFGPVFKTESKRAFGEPVGVELLAEAVRVAESFPVLALGGVMLANATACFNTGAKGVAAIRMLSDAARLNEIVRELRLKWARVVNIGVHAGDGIHS